MLLTLTCALDFWKCDTCIEYIELSNPWSKANMSSCNFAKRFARSLYAIRSKSFGWSPISAYTLHHAAWRLRFGPVPALWPHRRISHSPANRASQPLRNSISETSILLAVQIGPTVWLLVHLLKSCTGSSVKFPKHLLQCISVHEVSDIVVITWMFRNQHCSPCSMKAPAIIHK